MQHYISTFLITLISSITTAFLVTYFTESNLSVGLMIFLSFFCAVSATGVAALTQTYFKKKTKL